MSLYAQKCYPSLGYFPKKSDTISADDMKVRQHLSVITCSGFHYQPHPISFGLIWVCKVREYYASLLRCKAVTPREKNPDVLGCVDWYGMICLKETLQIGLEHRFQTTGWIFHLHSVEINGKSFEQVNWV